MRKPIKLLITDVFRFFNYGLLRSVLKNSTIRRTVDILDSLSIRHAKNHIILVDAHSCFHGKGYSKAIEEYKPSQCFCH